VGLLREPREGKSKPEEGKSKPGGRKIQAKGSKIQALSFRESSLFKGLRRPLTPFRHFIFFGPSLAK
jgi:hypothetical protein